MAPQRVCLWCLLYALNAAYACHPPPQIALYSHRLSSERDACPDLRVYRPPRYPQALVVRVPVRRGRGSLRSSMRCPGYLRRSRQLRTAMRACATFVKHGGGGGVVVCRATRMLVESQHHSGHREYSGSVHLSAMKHRVAAFIL
jgi:hypothetical protein